MGEGRADRGGPHDSHYRQVAEAAEETAWQTGSVLPYWKLQVLYALGAGAASALAWWLAGRSPRLRSSPRLRALWGGLALGSALVLWWHAARVLDDPHTTFQFIPISWAFYALCLWWPLLVVRAAIRARVPGRRPDAWLLGTACAAVVLGLDALWLEPARLRTVEHALEFEAWPAGGAPLRLVHVSDLQTVGYGERERRALERINALGPDLIVITGDYAAGPFDDPEPAIASARAFLGGLRARLGVVVVDGHSESAAIRERIFAGLGLRHLRNEDQVFELDGGRSLRVFGVPARGADLAALERLSAPGQVTVVASHVPDLSPDLDGLGVDLHLAGHTHGGQIALPWLGPPMTLSDLPRRYARGLHPLGDHLLHVSPGLGMEGNHAPRIRFLCPPEIDLLVLGGGGPALP